MTSLFAQARPVSLSVDAILRDHWAVLVPVLLGAAALLLLLPRARRISPVAGGLLGGAALALAGLWWINRVGPLPEIVLFYVFAGLAVLGATLMIVQSNPVYAALSFALVILASCGLFLLLAAPLLMAATIIIYAGAIVVTFLFVIMLAQQAGVSNADLLSREPFLAVLAGFVLLIALVGVYDRTFDKPFNRDAYDAAQKLHALSRTPKLEDVDFPAALKLADAIDEQFGKQEEFSKNKVLQNFLVNLRTELSDSGLELDESQKQRKLEKIHDHANSLSGLLRLHPLLVPEEGTSANQVNAVLPRENVRAIGKMMFTEYLLAFELAGVLLLVATIGAIVIAGRRSTEDLK